MKPCSAWCRQDEGVHVFLGSCSYDPRLDVGREVVVAAPVGATRRCCVPDGTRIRILAMDDPHELAPEDRGPYENEYLATVQVLP